MAQWRGLHESACGMRVQVQFERLGNKLALEPKRALAQSDILLHGLLEIALHLAQRESGDVLLCDGTGANCRLVTSRGLPASFVQYFGTRSHAPAVTPPRKPETIVVDDVANEGSFETAMLEQMLESGMRAMVAVPLVCARDGWRGWITVFDDQPAGLRGELVPLLIALERAMPAFLARTTLAAKR